MARWLRRMMLGGGLGLCLLGGFARAQPEVRVRFAETAPAAAVVVEDSSSASAPSYVEEKTGRRHLLTRWFPPRPWGCWATHNTFSCGSLKSECTFLFGSCRAFYGEPCLREPPPLPPGVPPMPPPSSGGCRCP